MASPHHPQLVFFDLDGTLARSKQPIEEPIAAALARLLATSKVSIISGGALAQLASQVADQLPATANRANLFLQPTSGAALYAWQGGAWTPVYAETLSDDEVTRIVRAIGEACAETGIVDLSAPAYGPYIEPRGPQVSISTCGQGAPLAVKEAWDPGRDRRRRLAAAIAARLPEFTVRIGGKTTIDVTRAGIDKAFGIERLCAHLQIPIANAAYVGDELVPGGNDEAALRTGIPVERVDGPDDTRAFIDRITEGAPGYTAGMDSLATVLRAAVRGEVLTDDATRATYSKDTSIFERRPEIVVCPQDAADVAALVTAVAAEKRQGRAVAVAARAAGTCMSGGSLTDSVVIACTPHLNRILTVGDGYAIAEPGVYYRDFEKATLARDRQLMPSYPASRELAAIGGMVNNDAGGERTLEYGKTRDYVEELEVVLADGSLVTVGPLDAAGLAAKKAQQDFEGSVYRGIDALITEHADLVAAAKPKVSKNSAGYALWEVRNPETGVFNLAKLIVGSQGTLAITTKARLRLIRDQGFRSMLVVFLDDRTNLPAVVAEVLKSNPESFESFDEHTLSLAIRFLPEMLLQLGLGSAIRLGWSFLPEVGMALRGGLPKLILMAEFSEDTREAALAAATKARDALLPFGRPMEVLADEQASAKYWKIRRESFALLRKHARGLTAAPFIDDFVVPPSSYPEFLPKLDALLARYSDKFVYTIAGHIGNGNFHIIPLMDLKDPSVRAVITELAPQVYDLVLAYGGSTTGEHNDGIIRTPYLPQMFGAEVYSLFEQVKKIFDPQGILNPGKKVGGTFADITRYMING